ncbi:glycoside hydrolase family 3 protein [Trematosphaeria pertusa]|uniref:xylan 1,4-beta-xylosidase n=1 Tax=Trematosphaeria pertusa TaxID=390896 RepID=A0A6A6IS15_9PLEO|nr:glycoside hydrolase family 3 protein [Trematosphaeria pertusa]KAF2252937.1 glycoside hydrolase family 3 protein [Trematosphaeria pertusa]
MSASYRYLPALLWASGALALFPDCVNGPLKNETICDTSASPLDRARSLVALYTLEEKINATGSTAPGVPRLGVPPYEWWSEGLHGIAGPFTNFSDEGDYSYSTSFPQPILMGAAFDDQLITDVATVIATEARAFNNANRTGLDFWTPNINPFRDPRWGRGQETPGEDPYHLSSYVHALINGLQGNSLDPYKRVVATCKHFAGYDIENWNGNFRYQFDAQVSQQDLVEYYLPPFQSCARDSNVGAFMCSYNAVNGVPTCADPYLLQTILREHWGWTNEEQWVTSDCDAVQNVFLPHQWSPNREQAAADSLIAGTDVNCGTYMPDHLPAAFAQGLVNESIIDQALIRQYSSLVRLGWFDPPENQPYRQLDFSAVATNASQALAYKAAVEGIVLLKNDGVLPLSLDSSTSLGLFGDWANATENLLGNYYGVPTYLHSPLWAAQQLNIAIQYAQGPGGQGDPTTGSWLSIWPAADASDVIVYVGGVDNSVEEEGNDRVSLTWTGAQLDVIGQLAGLGKPMVVVQMGGGQIDSSPIVNNPNISALLWGGYPGQDGGVAIMDILTGKAAPAGRLPTTQYPASYINEVPMTDMSLRPSANNPGRTYKWYNGTAIFEFGSGLHYTNFSASITSKLQQSYAISDLMQSCNTTYLDRCPFASVQVEVTNDGKTTSDYVTLGFLAGSFGPQPYPKKSLVSYQRLFAIKGGSSKTATLNLTLGSLSRVDEKGNKVLHPGDYSLLIDNGPLVSVNLTLTGSEAMLDKWPQPPANRTRKGVSGFSDYFVGGYGSDQVPM